MTPVLILQTVGQWPLGTRLTLVQDILKTVQQEQEGNSFKRKKTLHQALGLAATDQPAPTTQKKTPPLPVLGEGAGGGPTSLDDKGRPSSFILIH